MNNRELFIKSVEIYLLMNESPNIDAKQAVYIYLYAIKFAENFKFSEAMRKLDFGLSDIVDEFVKQSSTSNYKSVINRFKS